jgi:hypothetical protein
MAMVVHEERTAIWHKGWVLVSPLLVIIVLLTASILGCLGQMTDSRR